MVIKKFTAKTEAEAVEEAKKELGNGVVIMNVKQVKRKGLFASLRSKLTEVTVALEEEQDILRPVNKENEYKDKLILSGNKSNERGKDSTDVQNQTDKQGVQTEIIEQKLDSLQSLLENQVKKQEMNAKAGAEDEEAEANASDEQTDDSDSEQERFIRLIYNTMIDNEIDEKYANQLLDEIEKNRKPNVPMDYILSNIYQKMILKFGEVESIKPAEEGPKIVVFIGPTGVGKTTTIAKLASRYAVDEKKKVALLTADTYRIAAAEQLRTYANILEVPFRVIYTKEELIDSVKDFQEYDYIFVDTAGHSHQNEQQLGDMKVLLDTLKEEHEGIHLNYQCFLVLSATTKYKDLLKIAETYRELTEYQLIFTKLDETSTLGNLLNLKLASDSPVSYVTYGQNVPDDIEQFNAQKTVKQLLGGK